MNAICVAQNPKPYDFMLLCVIPQQHWLDAQYFRWKVHVARVSLVVLLMDTPGLNELELKLRIQCVRPILISFFGTYRVWLVMISTLWGARRNNENYITTATHNEMLSLTLFPYLRLLVSLSSTQYCVHVESYCISWMWQNTCSMLAHTLFDLMLHATSVWIMWFVCVWVCLCQALHNNDARSYLISCATAKSVTLSLHHYHSHFWFVQPGARSQPPHALHMDRDDAVSHVGRASCIV